MPGRRDVVAPLRRAIVEVRRVPVAGAAIQAVQALVDKTPSRGTNLPALDGLRGVAVLLVLASHTQAPGFAGHGAAGVWLFFTLSAFLLARPFAAGQGLDRDSVIHYFRRRAARILPLYAFVLVVGFLHGRFSLETLVLHLLFLRGDGVFWSIPQEVLFYAVLPVLAWSLRATLGSRSLATASVLLAVGFASSRWMGSILTLHGNGTEVPFHLDVFASGMAFAYVERSDRARRLLQHRTIRLGAAILAAALFVCLCSTAPGVARRLAAIPGLAELPTDLGQRPFPFGLACGALLWLAVATPGGVVDRLASSRFLRSWGVVSFGAYLLHELVAYRAIALGIPSGLALFAVTLAMTFAVACVTYWRIEAPFLRR